MEILVADDEPAVAVAIKAALKFYGHTVVTVSNGDTAIEHIRAEPGRFSAVVSDHNMPGLGGLGLVKALRGAGYGGRVIILSAFLNSDVEAKYAEMGVKQILAKPFHIEKLRLALDSGA